MSAAPLNRPHASANDDDLVSHSVSLLAAARASEAAVSPSLRALADSLGARSLDALPDDPSSRVAFWVNVYNALMRHAVVAYGLRAGARVPLGVFGRASYLIGGQRFSLHVIEHGLLRCNRPAPFTFWRPLRRGDPRFAAAPPRFDPRVHFALNCAAASCPPIRVYRASGLDAALDLATASYVAQECVVDAARGTLRLPYLCGLYARDFGDARAALAWLRPYLPAEVAAWVDAREGLRLEFNAYRWEVVR